MIDVSILKLVGAAGAALVVVAWLVVSFLKPGRGHLLVSRLGAIGLYVVLGSFFTYLTQNAWADRSWVRLFPFGLLLFVFVSGFGISVWKWFQALGAAGASVDSASH